MASAFGHALVAATIVKVADREPFSKRLWILAIVSAVFPDIDVVTFNLGIPYGDMLGHRGLTHSILFAVVWALVMTLAFFERRERKGVIAILFLSTMSHAMLDALTNGGLGVGFFIPFSPERFFFPWRPIEVSPIGVGGFLEEAAPILMNEFFWIALPCAAVLILNGLRKKLTA